MEPEMESWEPVELDWETEPDLWDPEIKYWDLIADFCAPDFFWLE